MYNTLNEIIDTRQARVGPALSVTQRWLLLY